MFEDLLKYALKNGASDIHITVGVPPTARINGNLVPIGSKKLDTTDTEAIVEEVLKKEHLEEYRQRGEIDLSYSVKGLGRFRVNVYRQRGSSSMALRVVALRVPTLGELGLPEAVAELAGKTRGLVLVTGPTGSGKSTTLAAMIDLINSERNCHILTLEDPIEYLHKHNKSIVNQREIGYDSRTFASGLRSALRQDPDVILVGEMRDLETISTAITAAETGHLVLSTLHTVGADKTIDRIIDVFPPYQQQQIRVQLSTVLQGVISQNLINSRDGKKRVLAVEVMIATPAIRNLIRAGKTHQIITSMQTGGKYGMQTMDAALAKLCKDGLIKHESALMYCSSEETLMKFLGK
ncbi:MAG: type IV pilus twitching motility protein PilT [Bacillota bacterium]|nr:type IV pilus twitching motility protein PilT [Bacillota bacterium]MDD3298634.1 type IV pilus twitching motility protein PilT [Bacillota bacterium]MDD3851450.1 type IV pilus twitching motility protein PilT [Bacillota bacterium]MDD4707632.1 type IV pilus twitching motility protein PilT [Bacillota bacterium]